MSQQPPFQPPEQPQTGQQYQPPQQPQYQPPQYQQPQYQPQQPAYQPPQQPGAHPGYGQPPKQEAPRHPGYGPTPGADGRSPEHQGGPSQPGQPQGARRNPLAVASVILGAVPSVLGLIFIFVQAGLIAGASSEAYGAVSLVQTVLQALLGIGALVLGLLALAKPGPGRALAGAGVALGAATLVGVLGTILYPLVFAAAY
ncbi:hypothetical protein N1028_15505 [Herbiconiux sp. CPCC 203407]|uniref:Uncharacterized protein n=1 Tax=Herbiconiux oxytropis TaxID=2970915 RepID=A0AA41XKC5_9MICO|nr:hypothetical protein [Herbiconiux oxytropis]MCS5722302.1 hypothetical protein [Herbiconiux oxytropis]MCS5727301.1 hypothetical protein [Herbiconiux oxytropis]